MVLLNERDKGALSSDTERDVLKDKLKEGLGVQKVLGQLLSNADLELVARLLIGCRASSHHILAI